MPFTWLVPDGTTDRLKWASRSTFASATRRLGAEAIEGIGDIGARQHVDRALDKDTARTGVEFGVGALNIDGVPAGQGGEIYHPHEDVVRDEIDIGQSLTSSA